MDIADLNPGDIFSCEKRGIDIAIYLGYMLNQWYEQETPAYHYTFLVVSPDSVSLYPDEPCPSLKNSNLWCRHLAGPTDGNKHHLDPVVRLGTIDDILPMLRGVCKIMFRQEVR